jgi:DNA-binding CsgD family transcriptional regulator
VSPSTVSRIKRKENLVAKQHKFAQDEVDEIWNMWEEGLSVEGIARRRGLSSASVRGLKYRAGMCRSHWTDFKVLANNLIRDKDVALVGTKRFKVLAFCDTITAIAERHGVSRRTIRRALLEIPGATIEERCSPRGNSSNKLDLWYRSSDFFQEMREEQGVPAIESMLAHLRAGRAVEDAMARAGVEGNTTLILRNFVRYERGSPGD